MLLQSAVPIPAVVWSTSRLACVVLSTAWNMLARSLDVPRVLTDEPFLFVDGMIAETRGACDVPRAPRCSERTSIVVVARSACTYLDVHVADALVPETATAQVEMLIRGMLRPVRWRVVSPVGPLLRRQALVASDTVARERGFRLYIRDFSSARGVKGDGPDAVAMYRIVLCGVSGRVTRIKQGRALFVKGPFETDIVGARTCVRTRSADVLLSSGIGRMLMSAVPWNEIHVLRMPVVSKLVVVQVRDPMDFARHELPAKCTAQLLLLDGSVVTLTDRTPSPMPVPLMGVAEVRFAVAGIECPQEDEAHHFVESGGDRSLTVCAKAH
jgi:hypothetical protein